MDWSTDEEFTESDESDEESLQDSDGTLTIYVLLGWLDEGNNGFGEIFLLFRVFVEIFFDIWDIFNIIFGPSIARVENNVENVENVEKMSRQTREKSKKIDPNSLLPKFNQPESR